MSLRLGSDEGRRIGLRDRIAVRPRSQAPRPGDYGGDELRPDLEQLLAALDPDD